MLLIADRDPISLPYQSTFPSTPPAHLFLKLHRRL